MAYNRKEIVKRLREEGRQAALRQEAIETCPYEDMDAFQWRNGWSGHWGNTNPDLEVPTK